MRFSLKKKRIPKIHYNQKLRIRHLPNHKRIMKKNATARDPTSGETQNLDILPRNSFPFPSRAIANQSLIIILVGIIALPEI